MKVLLDTNVLVAAFATRGLCEDVFQLVLSQHDFVTSQYILDELERILRTKLKMPAPRVSEVCRFVADSGTLATPDKPAEWPKNDEDDQWVVAAALSHNVDLLISGDRDLLTIDVDLGIVILSPRGFWESLR